VLILTLSLTRDPNPTNPKLQARIPVVPHLVVTYKEMNGERL